MKDKVLAIQKRVKNVLIKETVEMLNIVYFTEDSFKGYKTTNRILQEKIFFEEVENEKYFMIENKTKKEAEEYFFHYASMFMNENLFQLTEDSQCTGEVYYKWLIDVLKRFRAVKNKKDTLIFLQTMNIELDNSLKSESESSILKLLPYLLSRYLVTVKFASELWEELLPFETTLGTHEDLLSEILNAKVIDDKRLKEFLSYLKIDNEMENTEEVEFLMYLERYRKADIVGMFFSEAYITHNELLSIGFKQVIDEELEYKKYRYYLPEMETLYIVLRVDENELL